LIKTIGIIGCGWLGLPLAKSLKVEGYSIFGTTTSKDKMNLLKKVGIQAFQIELSDSEIKGPITDFLNSCETLIINVPPKLRGPGPKASYVGKMQLLLEQLQNSTITHVVFVSSTSVYSDAQGTVTEETTPKPTSESGKQLLQCEQLFKKNNKIKTTIVRFGGLIGPDRHPITMLSGKENLKDGNAPVNLIHLNDCILIIKEIINQRQWGKTYNAVHPAHPTKRDYYTQKAIEKGLELPNYSSSLPKKYKIINFCSVFLTKISVNFTSL
jgi:nucleoside-diphosphate-sugar epimerase